MSKAKLGLVVSLITLFYANNFFCAQAAAPAKPAWLTPLEQFEEIYNAQVDKKGDAKSADEYLTRLAALNETIMKSLSDAKVQADIKANTCAKDQIDEFMREKLTLMKLAGVTDLLDNVILKGGKAEKQVRDLVLNAAIADNLTKKGWLPQFISISDIENGNLKTMNLKGKSNTPLDQLVREYGLYGAQTDQLILKLMKLLKEYGVRDVDAVKKLITGSRKTDAQKNAMRQALE